MVCDGIYSSRLSDALLKVCRASWVQGSKSQRKWLKLFLFVLWNWAAKWNWNITRTFSSHFSQLSHIPNCCWAWCPSHSPASFSGAQPWALGADVGAEWHVRPSTQGPWLLCCPQEILLFKKKRSSQQQWWWNGSGFLLSWLWAITSQTWHKENWSTGQ